MGRLEINFTVLRDKILNEEYTQGQKLNEVALSKELNISRTPIREALKQLELEGLVKSIPNKGVYVLGFLIVISMICWKFVML